MTKLLCKSHPKLVFLACSCPNICELARQVLYSLTAKCSLKKWGSVDLNLNLNLYFFFWRILIKKKTCNAQRAVWICGGAGTMWLEGAVLAFDSVCKIFEALIIKICVSCGSSSISDINLFHALHNAQPRSTRRLLLQGASKLDCTPSLDKYFPPFVSVNHCYEAVLFSSCPSKSIFGEVDYVYLLSDGSSPLPWAIIKVSQPFWWIDSTTIA